MITALDRAPELTKYELLERIGLGGMATVYRARDRRLGREVAVKLIHPHLRESTEIAARFVSEARAFARIRHPNVVEVFDVSDENEPERYLVVELVRGTTLRALLTQHKALVPELAAAIGLEVAAALSHAHSQGIIHRDVKPENVLVDMTATASGPGERPSDATRIKLTDFGIAKLLDAQGVTSTGQVLGSPAHMAPEQIEGGDVGPRADVFALGVMLYECMVGRLPFDGKNPAQVLRRVLEGVYPQAVRENPLVGSRYSDVLARALARDPAERYESIEEFAAALRRELERVGITDTRREIERFLGDPAGYCKDANGTLVEALVRSGEAARAARDVPLAAAQFNRALAYRPGDPELVRRVTRLVRDARWARATRVGLGGGAVVAVAGLGALAVRGGGTAAIRPALQSVTHAAERAVAAVPLASRTPPSPVLSADEARPGPVAVVRRRPPPIHEAPIRPKPAATRIVRVDVVGPKGGYVLVDGSRKDGWWNTPFELPVGPHTFEFIPSDPECCRAPQPLARTLVEGDNTESVLFTVTFKDARLVVTSAPAGTLHCPTFFRDGLAVPGARAVPMSSLTQPGPCSLSLAEPGPGASPQLTKEVTLTAGQTTDISWP